MRVMTLLVLLVSTAAAQPVSPVSHAVYLGGGSFEERVEDIAVDAEGNVYLTGSSRVGDFAGGARVISEVARGADAFVVKLNPTLTEVLYAVKVGGSGFDLGVDLHVDEIGAVYVVGYTDSADLPVTEGVFQPETAFIPSSFLFKLAPEGDRLEFLSYVGVSWIRRVAADSAGKIWVTGATNHDLGFPFTDDALRSEFDNEVCLFSRTGTTFPCVDGFLLRLSPDARRVEYGSLLGSRRSDSIDAIALGPNGDVYIGGFSTSEDFPANPVRFSERADKAFVLRLDPSGSRVLNAWKAGQGQGGVRELFVRPSGELLVFGDEGLGSGESSVAGSVLEGEVSFLQGIAPEGNRQTRLDFFPLAEGVTMAGDGSIFLTSRRSLAGEDGMTNLAPLFVSRLDALGGLVLDSLPLSGVGSLPAIGRDGELFLGGLAPSGFPGSTATAVQASFGGGAFGASVARVEPRAEDLPFVSRVHNAASLETDFSTVAEVAPGEILTLRGKGLGPLEGVQGLATELAGVRVTLDDIPAPLLWVQDRQINLVAPWGLRPGTLARLVVERAGAQFGFVDLNVVEVKPGIFTENWTGRGQIEMRNEDGSKNTHFNPARAGETVTFWATGLGPIQPPGVDGRVQGNERVLVMAVRQVTVTMKDIPADVRFVGVRPGMVHGLFQVQAVVPQGMEPSSGHWVRVEVGGRRSQGFATISVE